MPGADTLAASDYLGIASANKVADKFARTGLHAVKSSRVDAPVITEYPLTLECEVVEMQNQPYGLRVLGRIVNVLADEKVLDDAGKIDAGKLQPSPLTRCKTATTPWASASARPGTAAPAC